MKTKIDILLIEDNPDDIELVDIFMREAFPASYNLTSVGLMKEGLALLSTRSFDAVLCDLALPDSYGMDTVDTLVVACPEIPAIVLTGYGDDAFGVNAVSHGAADFLSKNDINSNLLKRSIVYSIERKHLHTQLISYAKSLGLSERKYHSLFEDSNDPIYIINDEGSFLDFNRTALDLFGFNSEELQKLNLLELGFIGEETEKLKRFFEARENIKDFEIILQKKDGTPLICILTATLRKDESEHIQYHVIIRDVTALKKIEELRREKEIAEQASQAKQEFLSVMSHEIRTPLNAVLGITQLLLEENPSAAQKEYLNVLQFSATNLLTLLNNVLDFSKIESGKVQFEKINFDLHELVSRIIESFRYKAEEKKLVLETDIEKKLPEILIGDPTRLTQVLNNLLHNALKFTSEGVVRLHIESLERRKNEIELLFEVYDEGIGIETNRLDEIFDRFTQARSSTTRHYGGTGLGLYICKRFITLMGGTIRATSQNGKGSSFFFNLTFGVSRDSTLAGSFREYDMKQNTMNGKNILLVEDNETNSMLATKFITRWGASVDTAESGESAIEKVKQNKYDLVLMDIQLGGINGYEANRRIREMGFSASKLPVIALSAFTMAEDRMEAKRAGMNDFIPKPIELGELYRKLIEHLGLTSNDKVNELEDESRQGKILTLEQLLETFSDPEFRQHYLELLIRDFTDFPFKISSSVERNDLNLFSLAVHKISPSFERLEETRLPEILKSIETHLKDNTKNGAGLTKYLSEINQRCESICARIIKTKTKFLHDAEA